MKKEIWLTVFVIMSVFMTSCNDELPQTFKNENEIVTLAKRKITSTEEQSLVVANVSAGHYDVHLESKYFDMDFTVSWSDGQVRPSPESEVSFTEPQLKSTKLHPGETYREIQINQVFGYWTGYEIGKKSINLQCTAIAAMKIHYYNQTTKTDTFTIGSIHDYKCIEVPCTITNALQ